MKRNLLFVLFYFYIAPVFGQVKPFDAELFSENCYFGLTISPNGKELFFVKSFGGRDTLQIFHSVKVNGKWLKPALASFSDVKSKQIDPAFSPDGKSLFFNSMSPDSTHFDIYVSQKISNNWANPERISDSVNSLANDFFATASKTKNIYFTRRTKSNDIYVSYFKNAGYQGAVPLEYPINSNGNESNPFISPNEKYIIYFADYVNGFGDVDLYISFKKQGKWSYPINLGKDINSVNGEFCPGIDFKNKLFLFSRTSIINGKRVENMYTYPLKKLSLRDLRKKAKWEE